MNDVTVMISAVVPTHGGRASVLDTVRALLDTTTAGIEVIVVSDGDPAPARAALASVRDSRLRVLSQPKSGAGSARNVGLRAASHEWVAFVDDDDVPCPNWYDTWAQNVTTETEVVTACVRQWRGPELVHPLRCCGLRPDDPTMGASSLLAGAFIVRKTVLEAIGGYDVALPASQNQDLGLRLLTHFERQGRKVAVRNLRQAVIDIHVEDASVRADRYGARRAEAAKVFQERYARRLAARPRDAANLHRIIGSFALVSGEFAEARRAAKAAVHVEPSNWRNWRFMIATVAPVLARRWGNRRSTEKHREGPPECQGNDAQV